MNELFSCLLSYIWALGHHHAMTGVTELLSATLLSCQLTFPTRIWLERGPKHQRIWSIHHAIHTGVLLVWQTAVAHENSDIIDPGGAWQTCGDDKNARRCAMPALATSQ
jgi:hypothetical protein